MDNAEWTFIGYRYNVTNKTSLIHQKKFSTLSIEFALKRNKPYYAITMFIPIFVMTVLAPCGLILPGLLFLDLFFV